MPFHVFMQKVNDFCLTILCVWFLPLLLGLQNSLQKLENCPELSGLALSVCVCVCVCVCVWRRKWQTTLVSLPGEFHGQRSLVGYSPWGRKELDTTEWLTHTHTHCVCVSERMCSCIFKMSNSFIQGSASFFFEESESKYFPPCKSQCLRPDYGCVPIKLYSQKHFTARFGFEAGICQIQFNLKKKCVGE